MQDDQQILRLVKIKPMHDAEARTERSSDQPGARSSADQRKVAEWKRMDARARSLANDQVDAKIFHGRVQHLFDSRLQPVDFVEKENFLGLERSKDGREVAFALQQRTGAGFDGNI